MQIEEFEIITKKEEFTTPPFFLKNNLKIKIKVINPVRNQDYNFSLLNTHLYIAVQGY
jgi:hypothetical protein